MKKIERMGKSLSRVAFGGVIVMNENQEDANSYVDQAIDMGVNYFDIAPTYGDAELRLGPALVGKRDKVFLACKTEGRTKERSREFLENSLRNLKTDHFDLYQFHAVYTYEDVQTIFGPNGAMETYEKAKKEGLIQRIGFSAHSAEAALAMIEQYDFDSVMFPFNFASMLKYGYGMHVLKKAKEKNMTILGIKSMALSVHQPSDDENHPKAWYHPIESFDLAKKAVNYSVSKGVDIIIPPGDFESFKTAVEIEKAGYSISEADIAELKDIADKTHTLFPLKE